MTTYFYFLHFSLLRCPDCVARVVFLLDPLFVFANALHAAFVQLEEVHLSIGALHNAVTVATFLMRSCVVGDLRGASEAATECTHCFGCPQKYLSLFSFLASLSTEGAVALMRL